MTGLKEEIKIKASYSGTHLCKKGIDLSGAVLTGYFTAIKST